MQKNVDKDDWNKVTRVMHFQLLSIAPPFPFPQTFVPDEEGMGGGSGRQESSWLEAVERTHSSHVHPGSGVGLVRGVGGRGEVLQNPLYTEEDDDEEEGEGREGDGVEMLAMLSDMQALPPPSPTHSSDL